MYVIKWKTQNIIIIIVVIIIAVMLLFFAFFHYSKQPFEAEMTIRFQYIVTSVE